MEKMDWAIWGLRYLKDVRIAIHSDFNSAMEECRGYPPNRDSLYDTYKTTIPHLYHFSMEFVESTNIPCSNFPSPDVFDKKLSEYLDYVREMMVQLEEEGRKYQAQYQQSQSHYLINNALCLMEKVKDAIVYVQSKRPEANSMGSDLKFILMLARRFHEAVLCLRTHPYNGKILTIDSEWDCQYFFRALLAAYISDIRDEEWNPSVAGSSARCEFFLKPLSAMIELKYVHKASDQKMIKKELASDFLDYGSNQEVDHLICLIYDPTNALKNPAAFQSDLSGSKKGLKTVEVVISPPRT